MSLAASNVFLTVHGIGGEDNTGQSQVPDHLLRGRDLVGLVVDLGMRQDDGRGRPEGRQRLGCLAVVDVIEAASQRLAVERDNRLFAHLTLRQQGFRMASERVFKGLGVQRLEHGAQGVHHRRPLQVDPEVVIEVLPTVLQEGDDAAVRPGPAQQGQHREHQQIRQRIPLALRPPRVGNILQSCQKIGKRNHGTLHQGARH